MKPKTVISLLAVVLILSAASYFLIKDQSTEKKNHQMGTEFIKDLPINEITSITIQNPENKVELFRGPSVWQVKNRFNYPADFPKISDLLKKIKRLKIGRTFEADDDALARQNLFDPKDDKSDKDKKGTRITLADEKGNTISDLILGKNRQGSPSGKGQYIRHPSEKTVYLVNDTFSFLDQKPSEWLETEVINIDGQDIKTVICYPKDSDQPLYRLERPEKNKAPECIFPPKEESVDRNKIDQVYEALSPLNVEDVNGPPRDKDAPLPTFQTRLEYQLYDGKIVTVYPSIQTGEKPEDSHHYITLTVGYAEPELSQISETPKPEKTETDANGESEKKPEEKNQESKEEKSPEDVKKEALALNNKLKTWTFEIAKWQYDSFITNKEGLMEEKKESVSPN